jgi:hypothetical protein
VTFQQSNAQKSPGYKSRGCSRCKPRVTPRSDSGVNSERDLLRLESGCNTKFHSLPRWRRRMTQFGQYSKPANGMRLQGLEALELPPSNEDLDAIAQRRDERHSDEILLAGLSKLNALDYGVGRPPPRNWESPRRRLTRLWLSVAFSGARRRAPRRSCRIGTSSLGMNPWPATSS